MNYFPPVHALFLVTDLQLQCVIILTLQALQVISAALQACRDHYHHTHRATKYGGTWEPMQALSPIWRVLGPYNRKTLLKSFRALMLNLSDSTQFHGESSGAVSLRVNKLSPKTMKKKWSSSRQYST